MAVVGKDSVALGMSAIPHKHDLVWGGVEGEVAIYCHSSLPR